MKFISTRLASWPKTACLTPERILSPAQNADPRLRQHLMNYWHDLLFRVRVLHAMEARCKKVVFMDTFALRQLGIYCNGTKLILAIWDPWTRPPIHIHRLTLSFFHAFICSSIHPTVWVSLLSSSGRGQRRQNLMKLGSCGFTDSELQVFLR